MPEVLEIDLSNFVNPNYKNFFQSKERDVFLYGGANAGKSYAAAQKLIVKCLKYPKRFVIVVRKYSPSLRLSCFSLVKKLLNEREIPHILNNSEMYVIFTNGSEMHFLPVVTSSGEPAERIKSLTDVTDIWFEEPTELSHEEYLQVRRRMRGGDLRRCYAQRIHTFNPVDAKHWLKEEYFDKGVGKWLKYTYKDNPFVAPEEEEDLESLKYVDESLYRVYALGEWGVYKNIIYTNWETKEFSGIPKGELFAGVDFGFENPSVFLLLAKEEKRIYVIDEVYKRKITNWELIEEIKRKMAEWNIRKERLPIYCDASEPARIEEMEREGLLVYPAKGGVIEGINTVLSHHLFIHPRCLNTIAEIRSYKRREDRHGNVLEDPVKFNDHAMDALRYAVFSVSRVKGGRVYVGLV